MITLAPMGFGEVENAAVIAHTRMISGIVVLPPVSILRMAEIRIMGSGMEHSGCLIGP